MTKSETKRLIEAIEKGCYLGENGTMLDPDGNEYRDENGECVVATLADVAECGEYVTQVPDWYCPECKEYATEIIEIYDNVWETREWTGDTYELVDSDFENVFVYAICKKCYNNRGIQTILLHDSDGGGKNE